MAKRKTMTVAIISTQRKPCGYLILDQKLGYDLKKGKQRHYFTSGKNLQSTLCQNKPKLLPNSNHPDKYQLDFWCTGRCIGESKKKVLTRCIEHQQDSINGNSESSGATKHIKELHGQFNWIHPRTITLISNMYERKVCEALEINKLKTLNATDEMFQTEMIKSTKKRQWWLRHHE